MTGPTAVKAIRKQSAPELELRIQESELANRHKSEFLASMSHELRTPLHTIIGFSELLAEETKGPLNADQKRFIGHIRKDSQHLLALINEILDLSKIEAGKAELRRETLDIGALLEDVLTAICSHGVEKTIAFETRIDGPVLVDGDRLRVRQILYNLLSNAVKFTPHGGRIRVEAERVDGFGQISVSDSGIGIAREERDLIFDSFHQADMVARGMVEGTGLGLPISRRLVEQHGGRIWLESEPTGGSRFTFTIPLQRTNEESVLVACTA